MSWRGDGKELFSTPDDWTEMAVPVFPPPAEYQAGTPVALFDVPPEPQVDVTSDGQRFFSMRRSWWSRVHR